MPRVIEVLGKDIKEAKQKALTELNLPEDKVQFEILEEPSNGFLGLIGTRQAKIRATEIELSAVEIGKQCLEKVLVSMGKDDVDIKTYQEEHLQKFDLTGNDLGMLIGKHGQTLDAIQYLTNLAANHNSSGERVRIVLNVGDYRQRREETLCELANRVANKARRTKRRIALEPMSRHERKIIHMALQDYTDINTYSDGVEPYRRIVIEAKHNKNEDLLK